MRHLPDGCFSVASPSEPEYVTAEKVSRVPVAVVGATGYSGAELVVMLSRHHEVELRVLMSSQGRTQAVPFSSLHASLRGKSGPACEPFSHERLVASGAAIVLLATPNEASAAIGPALVAAGLRVIDLSGAFRLRDPVDYPRWYGFTHPAEALLGESIYALPEVLSAVERGRVREARMIANPGCYATSVILALWPLLARIDPRQAVIADCKSGVTGAGKRSELAYAFTELAGNFKAYATKGHRHEPEIKQALGLEGELVFVPHLLPVPRGILSSVYVPLSAAITTRELASVYEKAYADQPFVTMRPHGVLPELTDVVGTPRCDLGFQLLPGEKRVLVVSVLDNLLKGAASQAVQNLNAACGFAATAGLQ